MCTGLGTVSRIYVSTKRKPFRNISIPNGTRLLVGLYMQTERESRACHCKRTANARLTDVSRQGSLMRKKKRKGTVTKHDWLGARYLLQVHVSMSRYTAGES